MLLEGSLQRFKLAHVLQLLAHTGATGVLEVRGFEEHGVIYLMNGRIEGISLPLTELKLGTRLLQAGYLTEQQLAEALADDAAFTHKEKDGIPIGQRLIEKGFTTEARIRETVRRQASDWLFQLVQWQTGVFIYDEPDEMPDFRVQIQAELKDLLLEASQRIAESRRAGKTTNGAEHELCAVCPVAGECSVEIKTRYLKRDVCLWRSMSGLMEESRLPVRDIREFYRPEEREDQAALDPSLHW
ncbi:MAG: DUF4388 domain-containing protein [Actinomycetia bacterium]|nr:DUF4388 domain-containing protein [Actinomycetes bacterium]